MAGADPAVLTLLPENLRARADLLVPREREMLATILGHAESLGAGNDGLLPLVQSAIARAVGEMLLQRTLEDAGNEVLEKLELRKSSPHPPKAKKKRPPHPPKKRPPHPPKGKHPKGRSPRPEGGPHPPKGKRRRKGPRPPKGKPRRPPSKKRERAEERKRPRKAAARLAGRLNAAGPHPPKPPKPPGPGQASGAGLTAGTGHASPALPNELLASHVLVEEFLMPAELQNLVKYTLDHEDDFEVSEVVSPGARGGGMIDHEYRRSKVLMELGTHEELLLRRIRTILPRVLRKLKMARFEPSRSEVQITASNDGDFFHDHSDNGQAEIATRALTFVYFFHPEPKTFTGGELRIYDSRRDGDVWMRNGAGRAIAPGQNQIVFFPSELVHEITRVVCPTKAFADSRFTVNGWLHR